MPTTRPERADGVEPAVVRARLAAQHLTGRDGADPVAVVRRILAVQAQDLRGARLAVRSRTSGLTAADVEAALDDRRLVVAWLNRGTLHLVAAQDYWWLQPLTTPQLAAGSRRRLSQEGVSPEQAETGIALVHQTLVEHGPTSRDRLRELLDEAQVPTARQALVHVLYAAALRGLLIRGPVLPNGEQAFVDPVSWLGPPPEPLDPDEALGRLAARYLAGHAPATAADLAAWAGTTLGAARRGLAAAGPEIGGDGLARPAGAAEREGTPSDVPAPVLLGPFDPVLHGWASRAEVVGRHQGVVTVNGIFKPTAFVGGRVVGSWGLPGGRVTVTPLEPLPDDVLAALLTDGRDVHRYLGLPDREPVVTDTVPS